jgi:hypothetical protein
MAGGNHRARRPATGNPLLPLLLDVGVPLASYYLMRHFGVSMVLALAVSGLVPAVRVVWTIIRERSADGLALGVLTLTVVSIPVAFLTGSPKVLLAKDSLGTGALGIWLVISVLLARPAMSNGIRAFLARTEASAAAWERLSVESTAFRRCLNAATLVWAVGFVVECAARITIVVLLPVNTAVWAVNIAPAVVITSCIITQGRWAVRMARMINQPQATTNPTTEPLTAAA